MLQPRGYTHEQDILRVQAQRQRMRVYMVSRTRTAHLGCVQAVEHICINLFGVTYHLKICTEALSQFQ